MKATAEQVKAAREFIERIGYPDDVNVDDDAVISDAMPAGVWVSAWVWVPAEEE